MYAVIFRAEIDTLDTEYSSLAERMRELAINEYGCREFISCTEGNEEIAISYWNSEEEIKAWKQNAEHLLAQKAGRSKWYKSYSVQITEIVREYSSIPVS